MTQDVTIAAVRAAAGERATLRFEGARAGIVLDATGLSGRERDTLEDAVRAAAAATWTGEVRVVVTAERVARRLIAVASGKGGVGKSTLAANLAIALKARGRRVGLVDADIYGPSQPMMMGVSGQPQSRDGQSMEPLENYGVQVMSIGLLIEADNPMIWRGPMATQALEQLLRQTAWQDLDYLIVDMPPGTGDIQLTLSQRVPLTGAIIVTTPQDIALLDARKGLKMFEKVGVPILGIVENMAMHVCSNCGHVEHIFGAGGGEKMSRDFGVDYLGGLPLDIRIREQADSGRPTVVADPDGAIAQSYKSIARAVAVKVAEQGRDYTAKFPTISVQNS